ncbi:regulator of microtubule dynamics protein 3 isoform X3 [Felis catus]|uniref:regulator of microtubule dynamics protein 3 isoform X3 n=1 Tax=Felis catus TaxID=9685 RepID=UPI001D1A0344|nr:regulator of microtubule dynamics protein 3 isoform X3 [Felis catus]
MRPGVPGFLGRTGRSGAASPWSSLRRGDARTPPPSRPWKHRAGQDSPSPALRVDSVPQPRLLRPRGRVPGGFRIQSLAGAASDGGAKVQSQPPPHGPGPNSVQVAGRRVLTMRIWVLMSRYTTANAESDYEHDSDRESDDGEDEVSCETVKMGRKDSLDLEVEVEVASGPAVRVLEAGGSPGLEDVLPLLQQADELHQGNEQGKREGFQLLLNNKLAYGNRQDFLWRLARAYSDMCELTEEVSEKKSYALNGKEEAEAALEKGDENAECHQWYAVLCGQLAEHESIQRRIQSGFSFKEHVDKAIALQPENPMAHFLLGRWCYQVSHLSWLEKKTATALFESPLSATVQDALQSFLKAEELQPGFSKAGRVYISKCYRELGKNSEARQWMKLALELPDVTNEDSAFQKDLEELEVILRE